MARLASQALDVDQMIESCLDLFLEGGDIDAVTLLMVDARTRTVLPLPSRGARRADFTLDDIDAMALCVRCVERDEPLLESTGTTVEDVPLRTHLCHPLRGRRPEDGVSCVLAVVHLVSRPSRRLALDEAEALCDLLGLALQNALRMQYVEQQNRVLRAKNDIGEQFNQSPRLQETIGRALSRIVEIVRAEVATIWSRHQDGNWFVLSAHQSPPGIFVQEEAHVLPGQGEVGEVLASGRTRTWTPQGESLPRTYICVPLRSKGQVLGALKVGTGPFGAFAPDETALLERLGTQMGLAIENGLQFQTISDQAARLARRTGHLTALLETSDQMARSTELEKNMASCVQRLGEKLEVSIVLVLLDEGDGRARIVSRFTDPALGRRVRGAALGRRIDWNVLPLAARALHTQQLVIVDEGTVGLGAGETRWMGATEVRSALLAPLVVEGQALGMLVLGSLTAPRIYYPSDLDFTRTVANQLAMALERDRLFREVTASARFLEQRVEERTRALREANLRLQEATRQRSDFLKVMSHELRTPLNAILGFSELMGDASTALTMDEVREYSAAVHQSGSSLLSLINDILDLANPQSARAGLNPVPVRIDALVAGTLDVLRPQALARDVQLHGSVDAHLPPVRTDRSRAKQILYNLVANAVKFSPAGGKVSVGAMLDGHFLCLLVSDEGPGIPIEMRDKVFEPFVQASGGLDRAYDGAGLGLSLARRDARLLGGDVRFDSEVGVGTCFRFSIPLRD